MPRFDIVKEIEAKDTFRVNSIINNFDLDTTHIKEHFTGNIDIEGKPWHVGLIVGGVGHRKDDYSERMLCRCLY